MLKNFNSNFSCGACCQYSALYGWIQWDAEIYVGDTAQLTAYQQDEDCYTTPQTPYPVNPFYPFWNSEDDDIATIDSGEVTGVGVGITSVSASWGGIVTKESLTGYVCEETPIVFNLGALVMVNPPTVTNITASMLSCIGSMSNGV